MCYSLGRVSGLGLLVAMVEAYKCVVSACEGGKGGLVIDGCGVKGGVGQRWTTSKVQT